MYNLIIGRAGTGKTARIMNDLKKRGESGETGLLLIVPEQYSHDAEKQLSIICGDKLSLYGEVLSFTRLCGYVFAQTGGVPNNIIDKGGQILLLNRAMESVSHRLKVFGNRSMRPELLVKILESIMDFKTMNVDGEKMLQTSYKASRTLGDKLADIALISDAYDALLHSYGVDSSDRLTLLAERISESSLEKSNHIYFDGFNDFTAKELLIIEELTILGVDMTFCITCDNNDSDSEAFSLPRKTISQLQQTAKACQTEVNKINLDLHEHKTDALLFLEKNLFENSNAKYDKETTSITLYASPNKYTECEYAAYTVWSLLREGYRWRDIGVMARNWDEYKAICEYTFTKYEIPYFASGKTDILQKPPLALIEAAIEIIASGWEYNSVFKYIKTGLAGINSEECAKLENYAIKHKIKGSLWLREWILPDISNADENMNKRALAKLNELRTRLTKPLYAFERKIKTESNAKEKIEALCEFLIEIKMPQNLAIKAKDLDKRGLVRQADEYEQLWAIIKTAMEQFHLLLGDGEITLTEFKKTFTLLLSGYDVGTIPISLDTTVLGSMAMSRRRDIKCLIVLGATDENMPVMGKPNGVLSDKDREELINLGFHIINAMDDRYAKEMNMLYCALTLPSERLIVSYPEGEEQRPSFVFKRLSSMFDISPATLDESEYMSAALAPYLEYSPDAIKIADFTDRSMSKQAAQKLYGTKITLSPTRADRYYQCPFRQFAQNGLRLTQVRPSEFDAPAEGTFKHYVLESVSREIKNTVGYKNTTPELTRRLTEFYTDRKSVV